MYNRAPELRPPRWQDAFAAHKDNPTPGRAPVAYFRQLLMFTRAHIEEELIPLQCEFGLEKADFDSVWRHIWKCIDAVPQEYAGANLARRLIASLVFVSARPPMLYLRERAWGEAKDRRQCGNCDQPIDD